MQSGPIQASNRDSVATDTQSPPSITAQYGSGRSRSDLSDAGSPLRARSTSSDAPRFGGAASDGRLPADPLGQTTPDWVSAAEDEPAAATRVIPAGQRIADYEKAAAASSPRNPRSSAGFKVAHSSPSGGVQLTDFPNEILTQILSHLHPDSHGAVALVSKRFYALVTTPYAWRAAFLRYFAGQDSVAGHAKANEQARGTAASDVIRSEVRYFTRLTPLASWRSEYLLRTRLLRSVMRGRPGTIGSSARSSQSGKKAHAVLTYNPKLPWMASHVHADFTGGKKGPRVIHGTRDLGIATVSDPTTGRIEKWGLDDPFCFQQLDEVFPNLEFYGLGDGPAAVPNVMDVSQLYGFVGGEGFPGGRVYYKATGQLRGRYLGGDRDVADTVAEIPKIPELADAVSCVWIAKSSAVPSATQSMVGMMAGSTLGVVTSYALGQESHGPRYSSGEMTARWVLSPGVPIIDIKVDDQYSLRRKSLGRVWAVALNALGEVYFLTKPPSPPAHKGKPEDLVRDAWRAGRTACWELIESTRRTERPDEPDNNAVPGSYSPRSSGDSVNLSREQMVAEAREIEQFFRYTPAHFRRVCQGWDMLRKLEVDFAAGDENGGGESVFVITCGGEDSVPLSIRKFVKCGALVTSSHSGALTPIAQPAGSRPSIFGGESGAGENRPTATGGNDVDGASPLGSGASTPRLGFVPGTLEIDEWRASELVFKHGATTEITASAIDMSTFATMAVFEDPLLTGSSSASTPGTPTSKNATGEIPGRRARMLAVGTSTGSIVVWNMRDTAPVAHPVRIVQTDSPEVTALAVSALYLVHGGSDSLVQVWDPLASSLEPIRTVNAKSSGRFPRHLLNASRAMPEANYFSVRCIVLDPDATVLRGFLACGTYVRFWAYSSTKQGPGRKRRLRHSDIHGRLASRRNNSTVSSYIAAEEAELRHEQEHRSREIDRLRKRFGVGLGELTEEEALQYAQMISEESFALDEQRRSSASDAAETASSAGSATTATDPTTPEPSLSGTRGTSSAGPSASASLPVLREEQQQIAAAGAEGDYEAQIQMAIRLSLMEAASSHSDASPAGSSSSQADAPAFPIVTGRKRQGKKSAGAKRREEAPPGETASSAGSVLGAAAAADPGAGFDADDDLALALRLSLEEEEARQARVKAGEREARRGLGAGVDDEYPPLEGAGKGKGKSV